MYNDVKVVRKSSSERNYWSDKGWSNDPEKVRVFSKNSSEVEHLAKKVNGEVRLTDSKNIDFNIRYGAI